MNLKFKKIYLILSVVICAFLMSFIDGIIQPEYFVKSIIKVCLFLLIPLIYFLINKEEIGELKKLFRPRKNELIISLVLGICIFGIIIGGYFLLKDTIDFSGITENLTSSAGVNKNNFIYVSLYISFVNSLIEEFFFRGYAFISLKKIISRKLAYSISAGLFAIYHIGMTSGMFNIGLFILTLVGLYIGGIIFNILNEKSENIYCSWIVHMFANFAINTIGMILFGII